jgi:flavin reductase (DIM6/NTAB) family NADH-FMN oxidoreductase RutF
MGETGQNAGNQGFTAKDFRTALGAFATGVTVITTQSADHPYGMTANAFSSLSLDPPLVLVCVSSKAEGSQTIGGNGVFAVNVLGADQEALSRYFSSKDRPRGAEAFKEISHRRGISGSPILEGVAAFLDCRVTAQHPAGDHVIFVGEVLALGVDAAVEPLLFHLGRYRYLGAP